MNETEFLKQFQKFLRKEEFDCAFVEATEIIPYERLVIFLGLDEQERERTLEVTALRQEFMKGLEFETKGPDFFRIQFNVSLPFKAKPEVTSQIASLLCYLNRLIDLPSFEMNEIDLKLAYRYILIYGEEKFNSKLFISIVGIIMLLLELFSSTIEKVASGQASFNKILEEIIQIGNKMRS